MVSIAHRGDSMLLRASLSLLITLAACSDSGSTPDAAVSIDAPSAAVVTATCPSGTVPTISATDGNDTSFTPSSVTISIGQIVKFTMPSTHNVVPNPLANTDAGLKVNFNETKCLMFRKAGTFGFQCMPHGFAGTVVVTAPD
jgi:plastocyanin